MSFLSNPAIFSKVSYAIDRPPANKTLIRNGKGSGTIRMTGLSTGKHTLYVKMVLRSGKTIDAVFPFTTRHRGMKFFNIKE